MTTTKADQIRAEEVEAAELEGSFEASEEVLDLIAEHKKFALAEKEAKVQKEAISALLKEQMVKEGIKHFTRNGVDLTTLYTGSKTTLLSDLVAKALKISEKDFKAKFYIKTEAENPTLKVL